MILAHRDPEQLLEYLPSGKTPTLPDTQGRCNGLIWLPNDNLSELGHKMLDSAETLRQFASEMLPEEDQAHREGKLPRDLESVNLMDLMEQRRRHAKLNVEYTRVIKRARLEALRTEGVHAAELWSAALQMITTARTLLMDGSKRDAEEQQSDSENEQVNTAPAEPIPEAVPSQKEEPAPTFLNHVSSSASLSTAQTPAQTQPVTPTSISVAVSNGGRRYVPYNYYAIEHEPLLPTYPIPAPQTVPISYPECDHTFNPAPVNHPWPLDTASGVLYDEQGHPVTITRQEYIQTSNYEAYVLSTSADAVPNYAKAFTETAPKGPFQPGAATFEANFPALSVSTANKAPMAVEPPAKEKLPVTPSQPQRNQQQRHQRQKSKTHQAAHPSNSIQKNGESHKPQNLFHRLPLSVNCRIIARRAGAEGILSLAQQERIIKYATDWNSIAVEMRAQGAEEHQQIWKILDTVNCFTYCSSS